MTDMSKEAVMRAIERQNAQEPMPGGLLGGMRDPVMMRAREQYNRYALEQQQQGLPAAPFEDWYKQFRMQPQPQQPTGLRGLLDGLLGR